MIKRVALLGSTGSIGRQTLEVIEANPSLFQVVLLTANNNHKLLIEQALKFGVKRVVICNGEKEELVMEHLKPHGVEVTSGEDAVADAVTHPDIDTVLSAMVGFSGVAPTFKAIEAGKEIAIANKETLVAAGELVMKRAREMRVSILPIDSEHSALFQSLQGEPTPPEKLILTASGGPFFRATKEEMERATLQEALNHPSWKMGAKVTIDSATMMNKGLEMIEAHHLFNIAPKNIEIVVHPQSIVHSLVQYRDGSTKAQLSMPDMRLPIQYALTYPERAQLNLPQVDLAQLGTLSFYPPNFELFPALSIAYNAIERGGNLPCAMNGANEVAVELFLKGKIGFLEITQIVEKVLDRISFIENPTLNNIFETHKEALALAKSININKLNSNGCSN